MDQVKSDFLKVSFHKFYLVYSEIFVTNDICKCQ